MSRGVGWVFLLAGVNGVWEGTALAQATSVEATPEAFRNPPRACQPTAMWFWNDDLDDAEIRRQIGALHAVGIASFFVHPMFGFGPAYLSEEHFHSLGVAADEARRRGLEMHIYDEYNWPSGTTGGEVIRDHPEFRAQVLVAYRRDAETVPQGAVPRVGEPLAAVRVDAAGPQPLDTTVEGDTLAWRLPPGTRGTLLILQVQRTAEVLPSAMWSPFCWHQEGYLDLLNPAAVREFIRTTHERYRAHLGAEFGKTVRCLFTDEVALPVPGVPENANLDEAPAYLPWTPGLPDLFREAKGYDLPPRLHELFLDRDRFVRTRVDFWDFVADRFVESYFKPVARWCRDHEIVLTGHLLGEEEIVLSALTAGDPAAALGCFDLPGTDSIFSKSSMLDARASVAPKFGAGVARHAGAARLLCETYTGSGWALGLEDMKRIFDWQSVLGTNWLMYMGSYYSIGGFRKLPGGSYPPSHLDQRPDWPYYRDLGDYVARICAMNTQGEPQADVAVLVPLDTIHSEASHGRHLNTRLKQVDATFVEVTNALLGLQRGFDYLQESQLADAEVAEGILRAGRGAYRALVLPAVSCLDRACLDRVARCVRGGVTTVFVNGLPHRSPDVEDVPGLLDPVLRPEGADLARAYDLGPGPAPVPTVRPLRDRARLVTGDAMADPSGLTLLEPLAQALADCPPVFAFAQRHPAVLTMHRSLADREQLHVVNRSDRAIDAVLTSRVAGAVLRLDPDSGRVQPLSAEVENGLLRIPLSIAPYDACFVHVLRWASPAAYPEAPRPEPRRMDLAPEWAFQPLGGNLYRLDSRIAFGDDATPPEPNDPRWTVCDTDRLLAELTKDGFESWQGRPFWVEAAFTLEAPLPVLQLVLEDLEPCTVSLNGEPLPTGARAFVWDHRNLVYDVAALAKPGPNRALLKSRFPAYRAPHVPPFLALRGDFAVDHERLAPTAARRLAAGTWTTQGFPNFAGTGEYTQTFDLPAQAAAAPGLTLRLGRVEGVVEASLNGRRIGARLWRPYEFDLTGYATPGRNELVLRVTSTLAGLFEKEQEQGSGLLGPVCLEW